MHEMDLVDGVAVKVLPHPEHGGFRVRCVVDRQQEDAAGLRARDRGAGGLAGGELHSLSS